MVLFLRGSTVSQGVSAEGLRQSKDLAPKA